MIVEPEQRVADFAKAGADIISVHAEQASSIHLHRTLSQACLPAAAVTRIHAATRARKVSTRSSCSLAAAGLAFPPAAIKGSDICIWSQIRELGCKAGVVLNPGTPISCLEYVLDGALPLQATGLRVGKCCRLVLRRCRSPQCAT